MPASKTETILAWGAVLGIGLAALASGGALRSNPAGLPGQLTGYDAIRYAKTHGLLLSRYGGNVMADEEREGDLTVAEAKTGEDLDLVYIDIIEHQRSLRGDLRVLAEDSGEGWYRGELSAGNWPIVVFDSGEEFEVDPGETTILESA